MEVKGGGSLALAKFDRKSPEAEDGSEKRGRKLTTTAEFRDTLERIICARDHLNNGMSRTEAITMLADSHGIDNKKAANHYDYLVRQNMLPTLKQGGRVVRAQATTTNRTATTTEKLLRNHTT